MKNKKNYWNSLTHKKKIIILYNSPNDIKKNVEYIKFE